MVNLIQVCFCLGVNMAYFLKIVNGYLRPVSETAYTPIYSQSFSPGITTPSGTAITLPNSETYSGKELQIFANGVYQEYLIDWNYYGSGSKTQVTFTYDLKTTDTIVFMKMRNE